MTQPLRPGAIGEDPVVLAGPRDSKGVCLLRLRIDEVRAEAARVWGRERLPVVGSHEAVYPVGVPQTVQMDNPVGPRRVMVLLTLRRVRQVVQVPWDPNERAGEPMLDLSVEDQHSKALKLRVRRPAGDEFAPLAGSASEGKHHAPHDEDTSH